MDKYQTRYLQHQKRKKKSLIKLMKKRHSERIFSDKKVPDRLVKKIINLSKLAPSSCDRKAVEIKIIDSRDDKQLLGGLLVGGVGWIHRADKILLLLASKEAYKENLDYMPYLDAGVMINQIYLICSELNLKCCYVNPNVRENHLRYFQDFIDNKLFCGAIGVGYENHLR